MVPTLQLPILPPLQFIQKLFLNNCHGRLCYYLVDYLFNLYRLAREDPGASRGLDGMDVTCLHSIFHCTDCRPCHAMLRSLPRLRVAHACNNPCMRFSQCTFIRETHLLSLKIETQSRSVGAVRNFTILIGSIKPTSLVFLKVKTVKSNKRFFILALHSLPFNRFLRVGNLRQMQMQGG